MNPKMENKSRNGQQIWKWTKKRKLTKNPETNNLTNPYWEEQNSKAQH